MLILTFLSKRIIFKFVFGIQHDPLSSLLHGIKVETHKYTGYNSLSVSFQLTDLKERHEVVFGVTRSCSGAGQSAELCGRHWRKEERKTELNQTEVNIK